MWLHIPNCLGIPNESYQGIDVTNESPPFHWHHPALVLNV